MLLKEENGVIFIFGDNKDSLSSIIKAKKYKDILVEHMIMAEQTHSTKVKIVNKIDAGAGFNKPYVPKVDAIITKEKDLFLAVRTADCVPILLYDKKKKVIGVIHSGRKGTEKNIVANTLKVFFKHFFCQAEDIIVKIGPSISWKNYFLNKMNGKILLKLPKLNKSFHSLI